MSEAHTDDPEHAAETVQAASGDEILRTGRDGGGNGRRAGDDSTPFSGQDVLVGADGGERSPEHELIVSETADTIYRGWLPTGAFLTPGEVLAAIFAAEICWGIAVAVLALAERLVELPEPVAGHEFASTLLFGLVCGLYVLFRLRSRRLAWRKHLRGEL